MSREIKVRAWDKERKDMLYQLKKAPCFGVSEEDRACSIEDVLFYYKNDFELMQFTGLQDKSRAEIYEGDIVKITGDYKPGIYVVIWDDYRVAWWLKNIKADKRELNRDDNYYQLLNNVWQDREVIGNIYENPELFDSDIKIAPAPTEAEKKNIQTDCNMDTSKIEPLMNFPLIELGPACKNCLCFKCKFFGDCHLELPSTVYHCHNECKGSAANRNCNYHVERCLA